MINSTRTVLGPDFGTVTRQETSGSSRYNALELGLRYTRASYSVLAGYTYGKSVDDASNIGEQVSPFGTKLSEAPSAYDLRHNFVVSYTYDLPIASPILGRSNALTTGWTISGTTRFASGFPVTLYNPTDSSLLGTFGNGVNNNLFDTPNYEPGCDLQLNHNPAKGPAFNAACFSIPPLGQIGNTPRRMFYGPGIENFDVSLLKNITMRSDEACSCGSRPSMSSIMPSSMGRGPSMAISPARRLARLSRRPPRLVQLAVKFSF